MQIILIKRNHPGAEQFDAGAAIHGPLDCFQSIDLVSLSEIKTEHSDGVIRRELVSGECARRPEQPAAAAHPCSEINVSVRYCNSAYKKGAGGADAVRRR